MGLIYVLHEHSLEYITNRISPSSMYFLPHIGYTCKHVLQRQVLLSIRKKCCWHGWLNWWPEECYVFLLIMWYILKLGNLFLKIFEEILFVLPKNIHLIKVLANLKHLFIVSHQNDGTTFIWGFWMKKDDEHMHDFWLSVMITKIHGIKKILMCVYSHTYTIFLQEMVRIILFL